MIAPKPIAKLPLDDSEALSERMAAVACAYDLLNDNTTTSNSNLWHRYYLCAAHLPNVQLSADDLYIRDSETANEQFAAVVCINPRWSTARYNGLVRLPPELEAAANGARVFAGGNTLPGVY